MNSFISLDLHELKKCRETITLFYYRATVLNQNEIANDLLKIQSILTELIQIKKERKTLITKSLLEETLFDPTVFKYKNKFI